MITDVGNTFASATAITATGQIGDVIDLGPDGTLGQPLKFYIDVDTTLTGTAGGTATIALQACDYSGFGTSPVTLASSGAIALATMAAGTQIWAGNVPNTQAKRYLRLYSTNSVTFTAGKLDAGLVFDLQTNTQSNS